MPQDDACWQVRLPDVSSISGGEGGIRTHGTRKGSTVFETARFNHSRTSPGLVSFYPTLRERGGNSGAVRRVAQLDSQQSADRGSVYSTVRAPGTGKLPGGGRRRHGDAQQPPAESPHLARPPRGLVRLP